MTAQIAILNKSAVALAADSAVTLQVGAGQKIYNTVNKLFTLSKYQPVGIMVYGNSEFMGVPWESIIKQHRRDLGSTEHGTLRQYADGFLTWLSTAELVLPTALQNQILEFIIHDYLRQLRSQIEQQVSVELTTGKSVQADRVAQIVKEIIGVQQKQRLSASRLATIRPDFEDRFVSNHSARIDAARRAIFQHLPLDESDAAALPRIIASSFCRDFFGPGASGVVIAGFGRDEVFPSLVHFTLETLIDGALKWKELKTYTIDPIKNFATIVPFAQREMVDTFLSGIDPMYKATVLQALEKVLRSSANQIFELLPDTVPHKAELNKNLTDNIPELILAFNAQLDGYSRHRHIDPIINAVAALPKDELAAMAESLVNLTSFKRRISTDAETVGGEIDVAVISKGDGFIWIKRKHYFDAGKNPHFVANYYR